MISGETMQFCKLRRIFQYYEPSKLLSPEKYPHHVLLLFYPFRYQRELLSGLQTAKARSAGCCKHKQNKVWTISWFSRAILQNNENFMPKVLLDDTIAEVITSLNSKQMEVFNVVHTWAKYYEKSDGRNVEPVLIFLLGSGGTGKIHFVKVIHNVISKTLLYHCKDPALNKAFWLK